MFVCLTEVDQLNIDISTTDAETSSTKATISIQQKKQKFGSGVLRYCFKKGESIDTQVK